MPAILFHLFFFDLKGQGGRSLEVRALCVHIRLQALYDFSRAYRVVEHNIIDTVQGVKYLHPMFLPKNRATRPLLDGEVRGHRDDQPVTLRAGPLQVRNVTRMQYIKNPVAEHPGLVGVPPEGHYLVHLLDIGYDHCVSLK